MLADFVIYPHGGGEPLRFAVQRDAEDAAGVRAHPVLEVMPADGQRMVIGRLIGAGLAAFLLDMLEIESFKAESFRAGRCRDGNESQRDAGSL
jgi:hypothetical protein